MEKADNRRKQKQAKLEEHAEEDKLRAEVRELEAILAAKREELENVKGWKEEWTRRRESDVGGRAHSLKVMEDKRDLLNLQHASPLWTPDKEDGRAGTT